MAAASASGEKPSPGSTVSFLVAKLTELVATPGTFAAVVSTRRTQDAQVMPSTGMLIGSMVAGLTVWFMAESLVPPLCRPSHDGKVKVMARKFHRACRIGIPASVLGPDTVQVTTRERPMRKIIVGAFTSLDGVMQAPGGPEEDPTGGFAHGGWAFPF